MKLSEFIQNKLRCPATSGKLAKHGNQLSNVEDPSIQYPIIDGIPILINNRNSLFSIDDFINKRNTTFDLRENKFKKVVNKLLPDISVNLKGYENYAELASILPPLAKILVIGGSIKGLGMDMIYDDESYEIISSDVSFGPYTNLICDCHDIPFEDETFDCVIVQAVLEHVLEPNRCVKEIHRVLKSSGIVYSETPFMQQVHMRQYDFTRFTHLGHRYLFRQFDEIKSGPSGGPGMALAWSYNYFLRSFATSNNLRIILSFFGKITSFYLKYFDYYLINKPGTYDAASGYFFMGKKSHDSISGKELINGFKGI
jgi:SAM-dependent methyltransferase